LNIKVTVPLEKVDVRLEKDWEVGRSLFRVNGLSILGRIHNKGLLTASTRWWGGCGVELGGERRRKESRKGRRREEGREGVGGWMESEGGFEEYRGGCLLWRE
jgi:hypothetical protein